MKINLKTIPRTSGVYFFRDKHGAKTYRNYDMSARSGSHSEHDLGLILYIGKALNLRNRLKSYFTNKPSNPRIFKLLEIADRVTWQETDSEIEALILESQLIKKHRPAFNIMLRDDKQYFFVGFTKDKFPKIIITHQPQSKELGLGTAGPFTDGGALKITLRLLRRIFPYCTCKQKHNNYCLNYHIGKCLGFCCLKNIKKIPPKADPPLAEKKYHSNIRAIKDILSGKHSMLIKKLEKNMSDLAQKEEFKEAIELRDKIERLKKIFENALILRNADTQAHADNALNGLFGLKKMLKLRAVPKRIEGYDISNIQGQFATGAMVVFIDGRSDKNQYRKFKIKIENSPNDVAMLKEVLSRRFNHPEWQYPNLVIVDGGVGQLNAATEIIKEIYKNKDLRIVALTKDERHRGDHIYLDNSAKGGSASGGKKTAVPLKTLPESAKNLILQIDAEAHRFAINYYRKLHSKF